MKKILFKIKLWWNARKAKKIVDFDAPYIKCLCGEKYDFYSQVKVENVDELKSTIDEFILNYNIKDYKWIFEQELIYPVYVIAWKNGDLSYGGEVL